MNFLLRLVLFAAGLVFALSLLVMMIVLLAFWLLRALWCKLTGRPVLPFAMRMNPRSGFEQVFKSAPSASTAQKPRREMGEVTDVEPKR
jgi:hypothetical protein